MLNIAVIIGSLRKDSFNKQLVMALDKLNHPTLKLNLLKIDDIPLFNQDNENNMPPSVATLKKLVTDADGVLFATPEYNRSIPGVLKNIIDWGTRPYGQNVWKNKPIGIIGTSPGNVGTAAAQAHLRSILVSIGAVLLGLPEVYIVFKKDILDSQFNFTDENTKKFMQQYLDSFATWVEKQASK